MRTPTAIPGLTLEQVKQWLNIDADFPDDDALLLDLVQAAAYVLEAWTSRSIEELTTDVAKPIVTADGKNLSVQDDDVLTTTAPALAPDLQLAVKGFVATKYNSREDVAHAVSVAKEPYDFEWLTQTHNRFAF